MAVALPVITRSHPATARFIPRPLATVQAQTFENLTFFAKTAAKSFLQSTGLIDTIRREGRVIFSEGTAFAAKDSALALSRKFVSENGFSNAALPEEICELIFQSFFAPFLSLRISVHYDEFLPLQNCHKLVVFVHNKDGSHTGLWFIVEDRDDPHVTYSLSSILWAELSKKDIELFCGLKTERQLAAFIDERKICTGGSTVSSICSKMEENKTRDVLSFVFQIIEMISSSI